MPTLYVSFNETPHMMSGVVSLSMPFSGRLQPNQKRGIRKYLDRPHYHKFIGADIDGDTLSLDDLKTLACEVE